jgi:hypothetical protein
MPPRRRSHPGQGGPAPRYPGSFLLALREAATALHWQVRQIRGDMAECLDAKGEEHLVGLENLYRRARQAERDSWPTLIADFLSTVAAIDPDQVLPEKLEEVADRLLVRLGPPLSGLPDDARVWSQALEGTDLSINLVIDYPNRMAYVTEKLVQDSGQPGGHWLDVALKNLQERTPPERFEVIEAESGLRISTVADSYDSSRALILDRLMPEMRAAGWFAALPGRDSLFVLPVTVGGASQVHLLKVLAEKKFKSEPYPISAEVFWIKDETWSLVPIRVEGNQVTVTPPKPLVDVFERLASTSGSDQTGDGAEKEGAR